MNEGWLALAVIVATISAMIWIALNRHIIYPERYSAGPSSRRAKFGARRPGRVPPAQPRRSPALAETEPKQRAMVSAGVSGVATPNDDAEIIAMRAVLKLARQYQINETDMLFYSFGVKPGSGKDYKNMRAVLKRVQAEQADSTEAPARPD